jgi:hypothetical protein
MSRATVGFLDARGNFVPVKASRPLPTTGGGGGGGGGITEVNGQTGPVVTLDADDVGAAPVSALAGKVDRPANAPGQTGRLLQFDATGGQSVLPSGTAASAGAAVVRTTAGHIILPSEDPTNASWAVRKQYVDTLVAGLVTRIEALEALMETAIQGDGTITDLVAKTQAQYDALTPDPTTQYTIKGA